MSNIPDDLRYSLIKNRRVRRVTITVKHNGKVVVTMPARMAEHYAARFVADKSWWIRETQEKFRKKFADKTALPQTKAGLKASKEGALELARDRLSRFNKHYFFKIGSIRIKNQTSRWGSCSKQGNLNFNYNIINLPEDLADYILVHELCHIKEFNHSEKFWNLVAETIPDYKSRRQRLKRDYISLQ